MAVLVLLRHGESAWNAANVFTGWIDVGLSERGERQAEQAGALLAGGGYFPEVVHTSVQCRAIRTANLALSHGNTLRGLIKHIEAVSDEATSGLEVPNAVPLCYEFRSGHVTRRADAKDG